MARSLIDVCRMKVVTAKGRPVGKVGEVVFHPSEPRVVGLVVRRPRIAYVWDRADKLLALDRAEIGEMVVVSAQGQAYGNAAARRLGIDWDDAVVWMDMPAKTRSGAKLGLVRDGLFDPETGALEAVRIGGGTVSDIAVGTRDVSGTQVVGFDGEAVVFADSVANTETSGGAAAAAGKGAAVAKQAASGAAAKAEDAVVKAAAYAGAAAKVAARSDTGKKAIGWLKSMKDTVVDAMGEPDEDD